MKKIIYALFAVLTLASCGSGEKNSVESALSSTDIKTVKTKRAEVSTAQKELENQLKQLDSVIDVLDGNKNLPLVSVFEVASSNFNHYLEVQGDVMTRQNVLIYPEISGTLLKVYVQEGQKVSKGQLLAKIDDGGMGSQLSQLQSQAELAKTTFERQKRLWDQKIGSEIQFLQSKTNYEASSNAVKQLQSQLEKSSLRAPFSGIIDDIIKDQGTVVAPMGPGSEVFRIVNLSNMFIEVDVPESYLGTVTKGKEALVNFPILGVSMVSKVRQTGNFINPGNRSYTIEIPISNKNGNIKPNLTAKVKINDYTNENAIMIPQSIISENAAGEQYVYITLEATDNIADIKKQIITTGRTNGDFIEVLSGVNAGESLISEGARSVKPGQKVKIQTSK
ncbi:MAG: efflux transporter periplasmic adaptor subunit [Flavobacteriaceae bacterium]|nr:MAG: efflux transporter periplasmic adaptor subunit [Flavobacteriaceae bacterium]